MKILIVDDEQLARQRIVDLLLDISPEYICLEAGNGLEALKQTELENPDTVLLDIRMPEMDGLECAFHMSTLPAAPAVIFITAYDEHAVSAFEANAIDYLLKPVRVERLRQALDKAKIISQSRLIDYQDMQNNKSARTHLSANSQGKIQLIPVNEVIFFKADQKYVTVYWGNRQTLVDDSLKHLEAEFAESFIRVHRNALVSKSKIDTLEKTGDGGHILKIEGLSESLAVSRRHIANLKKTLKHI